MKKNKIPKPLEIEDPELGKLFKQIANKELSAIVNGDRVFETKNNKIIKEIFNYSSKIKRNDPCPCGSGKKYKKCCLK